MIIQQNYDYDYDPIYKGLESITITIPDVIEFITFTKQNQKTDL